MNAILETTAELLKTSAIEAPEVPELGEFKIVVAAKRTIKGSCSGQVIEALKRAKAPLTLSALASRVSLTKAGKTLKVHDTKARVKACAEWYEKNTDFVAKTEEGTFFLTRV